MNRCEWLAAAAFDPVAAQTRDESFFQILLENRVRAEPEAATAMRLFSGGEEDCLDSQLSDISAHAQQAGIAARTVWWLTRAGEKTLGGKITPQFASYEGHD